ncbi:MAG: twin-arginine translocation signal domain-containing protein [Planctomycetota bacterium]
MNQHNDLERRDFLKLGTAAAGVTAMGLGADEASAHTMRVVLPEVDSLCHGPGWESLNPGYWKVENGALRRRFDNYGDRARATGFPFHYETHQRDGGSMSTDYDPSLPAGVIYRNDWKPAGNWSLSASFVYHGEADVRREGDSDEWKMYRPGHSLMGFAFGAKSLFESYGRVRRASFLGWSDDGRFGFTAKSGKRNVGGRKPQQVSAPKLEPGDVVAMTLRSELAVESVRLIAAMSVNGKPTISVEQSVDQAAVDGYVGVVGRGLADFSVSEFEISASDQQRQAPGDIECFSCYPLGDTLRKVSGKWQVRFVGLFATDGQQAEIRVSDSPNPQGGWDKVAVSGRAPIVNHEWRRNTATIHTTLPIDPSEATLYYTVWKDGTNVTADTRVGTDSVGPGTGYVGDVPSSGDYVGRLPRLTAPYKLCGLSCHAITSGLQQRDESGWKILGGGDDWQFRDQPTLEAYKHLEDYGFQIMCWEDDVWYLELVLYPPSTDDAYRMIAASICGPTSRWQMMRHWNVINPGDHDYGMDDIKGPEQLILRLKDGLGQDRDYLRRNFQIVQHLITGDETVDPDANPKKWRAWKMPQRDFTLAIVDSRLWRSSQDTAIWDDEGWGHLREIYDRADPTRSLLGEEQFAWLQELMRTDSSRLICLTGLNGLHTVWTGGKRYSNTDDDFAQRDRVAADYAGWVAAGADRVIELLGSRDGVVTVYGDVHNGCIMKNAEHRLIECSFGPIGRSGGRSVIEGFGPQMQDYDGRPVEVTALYHKTHADPELNPHAAREPFYWNFLEASFDPRPVDPTVELRIRNLVDAPNEPPRGGGSIQTIASQTGRIPSSVVPALETLPSSDVRIVSVQGKPIRGTRSDPSGHVEDTRLVDVRAGTEVIVTAFDGDQVQSQLVTTI